MLNDLSVSPVLITVPLSIRIACGTQLAHRGHVVADETARYGGPFVLRSSSCRCSGPGLCSANRSTSFPRWDVGLKNVRRPPKDESNAAFPEEYPA